MNPEQPIHALRKDLLFSPVEENGQKFMVLSDPKGYAKQAISFPEQMVSVFLLLDGKVSLKDLGKMLITESGEDYDTTPLINLFEFLDYAGYMESPRYFELKEDIDSYLKAPVRPPICVTGSYSEDRELLLDEISAIMNSVDSDSIEKKSSIIISPHLDYRTGKDTHEAYASAYHSLDLEGVDTVVILGTSHFVDNGLFMLSEKDFETPLAVAETDRELISKIAELSDKELIIDEIAHRSEHSVELQLLPIQYLMKDRNFKILPILTGSFYKYVVEGTQPKDDPEFSAFIDALTKALGSLNRKAIFIAGADFAHIGRKFEDPFDAEPELDKLKIEDQSLIDSLEVADADNFFKKIADVGDSRKICGLSPIYSLLKLCQPKSGKLLQYKQWNEVETKSAVTIASMSFSNK